MKLLLIPASYPHSAAPWAGAPNESSALTLQALGEYLEVLVPRPYAPRPLALSARWRPYVLEPARHVRHGITIHRPAFPMLPRVLPALWPGTVAFLFCRPLARRLHARCAFVAILSFVLAGTGELAWRLGRDLRIPVCGWATGSDSRWGARSPIGRSVRETLRRLDLVVYQSEELKALAARLLGVPPEALPTERHIVQPRGIREPAVLPGAESRHRVRSDLGVADGQIMILYLGRIVSDKGLFELVETFARRTPDRRDLVLILVGARAGHDQAPELERRVLELAAGDRVRILQGCEPSAVWDYLVAADIFAFPSFREGMPNSLLEAMWAGLPAVAFAIPAVLEISRHGDGLLTVEPYDFSRFGDALLALASDPSLRRKVGEAGRELAREHFSAKRCMRVVLASLQTLTAHAQTPTATRGTP